MSKQEIYLEALTQLSQCLYLKTYALKLFMYGKVSLSNLTEGEKDLSFLIFKDKIAEISQLLIDFTNQYPITNMGILFSFTSSQEKVKFSKDISAEWEKIRKGNRYREETYYYTDSLLNQCLDSPVIDKPTADEYYRYLEVQADLALLYIYFNKYYFEDFNQVAIASSDNIKQNNLKRIK